MTRAVRIGVAIAFAFAVACGAKAHDPDQPEREELEASRAMRAVHEDCPSTFSQVRGSCDQGASCTYPEGTCTCIVEDACAPAAGRTPEHWHCVAASSMVRDDGCPGTLVGRSTCATEGMRCEVRDCGCVLAYVCQEGIWLAPEARRCD